MDQTLVAAGLELGLRYLLVAVGVEGAEVGGVGLHLGFADIASLTRVDAVPEGRTFGLAHFGRAACAARRGGLGLCNGSPAEQTERNGCATDNDGSAHFSLLCDW